MKIICPVVTYKVTRLLTESRHMRQNFKIYSKTTLTIKVTKFQGLNFFLKTTTLYPGSLLGNRRAKAGSQYFYMPTYVEMAEDFEKEKKMFIALTPLGGQGFLMQ
jgi:hypothetical protein